VEGDGTASQLAATSAAAANVSLYIEKAPEARRSYQRPEPFLVFPPYFDLPLAFGISIFETVMLSPFISPVSATV
jgi:hypothetical protein